MLWGQAPDQVKPGEILEPSLWLGGALLLGALILIVLQRWRRHKELAAGDPIHEQLAKFREAYERGDMSETEYRRVHALLAAKIQEQLGGGSPERPAPSDASASPSSATSPPPAPPDSPPKN